MLKENPNKIHMIKYIDKSVSVPKRQSANGLPRRGPVGDYESRMAELLSETVPASSATFLAVDDEEAAPACAKCGGRTRGFDGVARDEGVCGHGGRAGGVVL